MNLMLFLISFSLQCSMLVYVRWFGWIPSVLSYSSAASTMFVSVFLCFCVFSTSYSAMHHYIAFFCRSNIIKLHVLDSEWFEWNFSWRKPKLKHFQTMSTKTSNRNAENIAEKNVDEDNEQQTKHYILILNGRTVSSKALIIAHVFTTPAPIHSTNVWKWMYFMRLLHITLWTI